MAVPYGKRFPVDFDELFPMGAFILGDVTPVTEYQSQEDRARNRPVRSKVDEATGLPLFRVTVADPSAEKDRDKSITVEIAAKVCPVPPATAPGMPFRPVVLEGVTIQPRAEMSGQAKWITWIIRATGFKAVQSGNKPSSSGGATTDKAA